MNPNPSSESPSQRLAAELAAGVSPEQVLHTIHQAMSADTVARDGSRQPDHRTRLDAAKVLLAYAVGTPVARSESVSVSVDADSTADLSERLRHSPALRALFRKILDSAEGPPAIDA